MMRLDNVTVQGGKGASLVVPSVCVCGSASTEPSRVTQPAPGALCSTCGGNRAEAAEPQRPEGQQRRKLQDFLSGFV
jgi:hypothetical protein